MFEGVYLKEKTADLAVYEEKLENENIEKEVSLKERDLHILLSTFVNQNPYFNCYTKTIYHEKSKKREKEYNKYYPSIELNKCYNDLLGIRIIISDYKEILEQDLEIFKVADMRNGKVKMLWKIWHKDYGVIYDIRETRNMEEILYEFKESGTQINRKILQESLL